MQNEGVKTEVNNSVDNEDEMEYEETIDMMLWRDIIEIGQQYFKEDFIEIWNFLRELDSLDDDKLKKEIQKYLKKKDENEVNKIFEIIRQCEVIKDCECQKDCRNLKTCKIDRHCKLKILQNPFEGDGYNSFFLLIFLYKVFDKKYNGNKYRNEKMKNSVARMMLEGRVMKMIDELHKNNAFALAKEQYPDVLINIHSIGLIIGNIRKMNAIDSEELHNSISSIVGAKNIGKKLKIHNGIKDIIKQIAKEKYDNGNTDWHNDMANRINANFKVLKNNQENTIKDAVFLKHLPELKEFMEAVDSAFERYKKKSHFEKCKERNKDLTLEDYEKTFYDKYIGINVIRDTIKGIAYSYKRVFGVHNTTVVKKS